MSFTMVAPCHFGLEKILAFELKRAGGEQVTVTDGRVRFTGDERVLARANMSCSVAERIGVILAEFPAKTFDDVFFGLKKVPVQEWIPKNGAFPVVKGQSVNSALSSIPALQRTVKKAVAEAMAAAYHLQTLPEDGALYPIRFFLHKDYMTVYLDSSGEGLHKRGYRANANLAPIKETLAAGIVDLARVRENDCVIDPFCGSGTILIEAALKAHAIPPCLNRRFAAHNWSFISADVWKSTEEELRMKIKRDIPFQAIGYDSAEECISLTLENARKAGVQSCVTAERRSIRAFSYPVCDTEKIKVITNPPYAERMLDQAAVEQIYRDMGKVLLIEPQHPVYIINANESFERCFGQSAKNNRKLYNGMLMCRLFMYE